MNPPWFLITTPTQKKSVNHSKTSVLPKARLAQNILLSTLIYPRSLFTQTNRIINDLRRYQKWFHCAFIYKKLGGNDNTHEIPSISRYGEQKV